MDARKWQALYLTYYEDLKGLSVEQLRDGCRRWRNNPENTKFPTPGQLREACRNPFEAKDRRYAPLDDLPPALPPEVAQRIIEKTRAKYEFTPAGQEPTLEQLKEAARNRKTIQPVPIPMTRDRRNELLRHIKQNLEFKLGHIEAGRYIAELPDHDEEFARPQAQGAG